MDLTFQDPGLGYSVDSIMDFQTGDQSDFWKAPLFYFYPQLDRVRFDALPPKEQVGYLKNTLQEVYDSALIAQKVESYQVHWESNRKVVEEAMSDAFGLDPGALYNDLVVNVTLNSISPRYLQERRFDVFYLNSPKGALGVSLHEMVHFLWFYVGAVILGIPLQNTKPRISSGCSAKWRWSRLCGTNVCAPGTLILKAAVCTIIFIKCALTARRFWTH